MKKALKYIITVLVASVGLMCGLAVLYYIDWFKSPMKLFSNVIVWLPITISLLSIPSALYNLRTTKARVTDPEVIDDFLETGIKKVNRFGFLWFCNLLLGIELLIITIRSVVVVLSKKPISELYFELTLTTIFGLLGMGLIFGSWQNQKSELHT